MREQKQKVLEAWNRKDDDGFGVWGMAEVIDVANWAQAAANGHQPYFAFARTDLSGFARTMTIHFKNLPYDCGSGILAGLNRGVEQPGSSSGS